MVEKRFKMEINKEEKVTSVSTENIYKLNGRVPLKKAIPLFGLSALLSQPRPPGSPCPSCLASGWYC